MTTVTVQWARSKKAALDLFAQIGTTPGILSHKIIDLEPLNVEQRRQLLAQAYNPGQEKLSTINVHGQKTLTTTYPVDLSTNDYPVEFDTEPSVEQAIEAIHRLATMESERKAEVERKAAAERVRLQKRTDDERRVLDDLQALEKAVDLDGAKAYVLPSDDPRLASYKDGTIRTIRNKMADAEKARWVSAHGSDHLKRACAGGYDCQRLYIVERAAHEAPGWIVDYNGTGRENSRSCPSMEALEIEADAAKLAPQIGTSAPSIVWLTDEPSNKSKRRDDDDWNGEMFEECEAVMMRGYLGNYDLYKIV